MCQISSKNLICWEFFENAMFCKPTEAFHFHQVYWILLGSGFNPPFSYLNSVISEFSTILVNNRKLFITTTITIIIPFCFSCGDATILSSAFFIHNIWPCGIVLVNYIYMNYRFQLSFIWNISFRSKYCSRCNNRNSTYLEGENKYYINDPSIFNFALIKTTEERNY